MKNFKQKSIYIACGLVGVASLFSSCKKDFVDPSRASIPTALGSTQSLSAVATGIQRIYSLGQSSSVYNAIVASGFSTNEIYLLNSGNVPELQLFTGGSAVDGTNTVLLNLWANSYKVLDESNKVITASEALGDKSYASGLIGQVTIFKALALGNLAGFWEKAPITTGTNVPFVDRQDVYKAAITAIDKALAAITANPISSSFTKSVPNLNIVNALHALKARYALFTGQYTLALTEANLVVTPTITTLSAFTFDAANGNVLNSVVSSNNIFRPTDDNLGLPASLAPDVTNDGRIAFYRLYAGTPSTIRMRGFSTSVTSPIPVFLPGEIALIKAEAYTRQTPNDLNNGLTELNKVVTKTAASDAFGVGAGLTALTGPFTQAQLLDQIYKHRSIELYASGLKLEDMRRFGRPQAEMKRRYMPYPIQERDNNTNTPANPSF